MEKKDKKKHMKNVSFKTQREKTVSTLKEFILEKPKKKTKKKKSLINTNPEEESAVKEFDINEPAKAESDDDDDGIINDLIKQVTKDSEKLKENEIIEK